MDLFIEGSLGEDFYFEGTAPRLAYMDRQLGMSFTDNPGFFMFEEPFVVGCMALQKDLGFTATQIIEALEGGE